MRSELAETLAYLDSLARRAGVVPVLFGTAVLEILGIGNFSAGDLDVIVSPEGAGKLAATVGIDPGEASGNDRFRSVVHLHLDGAPLMIDVMADMSINTADGWVGYQVNEAMEVEADGMRFRAASLADLQRFYRLAARAKDEAKLAALHAASA